MDTQIQQLAIMKLPVSFILLACFAIITLACEDGWQSYNGHCYKYYSESATRDAASRTCNGVGGYLACVMDNSENDFIANIAGHQRAYIGHIDVASEGVWRCAETAISTERISLWWRGEPNNCCGGENCAEINFGGPGSWNDVGCGANFQYVCEKEAAACEDDWTPYGSSCYRHFQSPLNFDSAEASCVNQGAHLVCVDTQEENDFVAEFMGRRRGWIGHHDRGHEGIWMCTSEDGNNAHWRTASREPNNCCSGEDCAEINFGGNGLWNDLRCSGRLPFVCEKLDTPENTFDQNCEAGWTMYGNTCYKVFPAGNFEAGKSTCQQNNAHPVCVEDENENTFLTGITNGQRTYIGNTDSGVEGIWHCEVQEQLTNVWWNNEPNNCCGGEDCAEINFGGRGRWNDNSCNARLASVCESATDPGSWTEHAGHFYFYQSQTMTWRSAQLGCLTMGGNLVAIDSNSENNFVAELARGGRAWIGSTDEVREGVWMSTGESFRGFWYDREPNDWGSGEDCAETNFHVNGKWNDVGCGATFPIVCEKPVNSFEPSEFVRRFFTKCVTDSREECKNLLITMAGSNCDQNRDFLSRMTGLCAVQN